jgi:hypothetical protein
VFDELEFDVRRFGADPSGSNDSTDAFIAAVAAAAEVKGTVLVPPGDFLITDTIVVSASRVRVRGAGPNSSTILFAPGETAACFRFMTLDSSVLYQCSIRGLGFAGDNTETKTAIELVDTSRMIIEDIATGPWTGNGDDGPSMGVRMFGRELNVMHDVNLNADIPLRLSANPNTSRSVLEDTDQFHFYDAAFQSGLVDDDTSNPCVLVDDDVNVSSMTFDGYIGWIGGTHGFYYSRASGAVDGLKVAFRNVKREQSTDPDAYNFYIAHTGGSSHTQELTIENCYLNLSQNGIYLRSVLWASIRNVTHAPTTSLVVLDADSTVQDLKLDNCQWSTAGTASITGLIEVWSLHQGSNRPLPMSALYLSGNEFATAIRVGGVRKYAYAFPGTADLTYLSMTVFNNYSTMKSAIVTISAYGATGPILEGGTVIAGNAGATAAIVGGTANFVISAGSGTAGKLNVNPQNPLQFRTRLGQTVDIVVDVTWI